MTLKQESVHLGAFPKQCIKIAGVFLNRVLRILVFFVLNNQGFKPSSAAHLYPNIG